jgi:hypothetical protein
MGATIRANVHRPGKQRFARIPGHDSDRGVAGRATKTGHARLRPQRTEPVPGGENRPGQAIFQNPGE